MRLKGVRSLGNSRTRICFLFLKMVTMLALLKLGGISSFSKIWKEPGGVSAQVFLY